MTTQNVTINPLLDGSKSYELFDENNFTITGDDYALSYAIKGSDLKTTAKLEDVKVTLKATVAAGAKVDGFDVTAGEYTMELVESGDKGSSAATLNKYMFRLEPNYNGAEATEKHYVYIYLDESDFNVDEEGVVTGIKDQPWSPNTDTNITLKNLQLKIGTLDFNQAYYEELKAAKAAGGDAFTYAKDIAGKLTREYTYTFENYAADDVNALLKINGHNMNGSDPVASWTVKGDDDVFVGTRLWESATSTSEDEAFNLGTGSDSITFKGDFGKDTITYNKYENLDLSVQTKGGSSDFGYTATVKGNDVVIDVTDVSYYATFTPTADTTWDSYTYKKGTEYRLELVQVAKSSNESQLPSGSYTWGFVERNATASETEAGYGDKISLFLDYTDVKSGKVFGADIVYHKVVNGKDTVVSASDLYGSSYASITKDDLATANATLFNSEISGTVTVKNYNAMNGSRYGLTVNDTSVEITKLFPLVV